MAGRDLLPHWPGCKRYLVLPHVHDDGRRTVTCWTCSAQITLSPNGRVLARHEPTDPPAWHYLRNEER